MENTVISLQKYLESIPVYFRIIVDVNAAFSFFNRTNYFNAAIVAPHCSHKNASNGR